MSTVHRWLATAALAVGLGMGAMTPGPAHAQSGYEMARVVVDVADVIFRGGYPYYRHGNGYGYDDRLIVVRDRYGRPVYYRQVPRYRNGPPYGNAYGYYGNRGYNNGYNNRYNNNYNQRRVTCDRNGRCVTRYYDPRYDRRHNGYDNRYYDGYDEPYGYYGRGERYWDGHRWRTR